MPHKYMTYCKEEIQNIGAKALDNSYSFICVATIKIESFTPNLSYLIKSRLNQNREALLKMMSMSQFPLLHALITVWAMFNLTTHDLTHNVISAIKLCRGKHIPFKGTVQG